MQVIGETGANKVINDYSQQFQRDFLQLLRTSHTTKSVQINHFYQQYIADKQHIHMNATRWPSLTEFAKHLGREGICRVEDSEEKGLHIAWIDNSPEALRRQEAIRKKERQDKGDEEREQKLIKEQIERARLDAEAKAKEEGADEAGELKREDGQRIKLSFAPKAVEAKDPSLPAAEESVEGEGLDKSEKENSKSLSPSIGVPTPPPETVSLKMDLSMNKKPKNVFAGISKKNALGSKRPAKQMPDKPLSEAARIMKEEIESKNNRGYSGGPGTNPKRPRLA